MGMRRWAAVFGIVAAGLPIPLWAAPEAFRQAVVADSPVAYWRFAESLGATSAVDQTGFGNNGVYADAGVTLGQAGISGGDTAALFSGWDNVRVVVPNAAPLNPPNISIEAVIRWHGEAGADGGPGLQQRIVEKSSESAGTQGVYGLSVEASTSKIFFEVKTVSGAPSIVSNSTISIGVPVHIVATYDGTNLSIYLNGNLDATSSAGSGPIVANTTEGVGIANQVARVRPFFGLIDELALYNVVLSATRIKAHASSAASIAVTGSFSEFESSAPGVPSTAQSVKVGGVLLSADLSVTSTAASFEVGLVQGGAYDASVSVARASVMADGGVSVWVRYRPDDLGPTDVGSIVFLSPDAGTATLTVSGHLDGGPAQDAGVDAGVDAGAAADAGADGGVSIPGSKAAEGCSCDLRGSAGSAAFAVALLVAVVAVLRRRRSASHRY